eukprot:PhF_6_TR40446/c1_g1_i1/m.60390
MLRCITHTIPIDDYCAKFGDISPHYEVHVNGVKCHDILAWLPTRYARRVGVPSLRMWNFCLECVGTASYVVACAEAREAFVIDPVRDCGDIGGVLQKYGLTLKGVLLTHCFEDVLMEHAFLAQEHTCAILWHKTTIDGQRIPVGEHLYLEVMHTPGHTPDSVTYILRRTEGDEPWLVFSGDTILAEGYGRFDVEGTIEHNAQLWSRSAHRILSIPNNMEILAAHNGYCNATVNAREPSFGTNCNHARGYLRIKPETGVGSATGAPKPLFHTHDSSDGLVEEFHAFRRKNTEWAEMGGILPRNVSPIVIDDPTAVGQILSQAQQILDLRLQNEVVNHYIPKSLCIPMPLIEEGPNAQRKLEAWLPHLLAIHNIEHNGFVVACSANQSNDVVRRLRRVGYEEYIRHIVIVSAKVKYPNVTFGSIYRIPSVEEETLRSWFTNTAEIILDVRTEAEYRGAHAQNAINVPVERVEKFMTNLLSTKPPDAMLPSILLYCARGYRSFIAASVIFRCVDDAAIGSEQRRSWKGLAEVPGGAFQIFTKCPDLWSLATRDVICSA